MCKTQIAAVMLSLGMVVVSSPTSRAENESKAPGEGVFELRTYTTHPGRLPALNQRFREHTVRLFEKHGMQNVLYTTPVDRDDTLVYILYHKSLDDARRSWEAFRADPAWQKARAASEQDGPIVKKVESVYLKATDYSPIKAVASQQRDR